MTTEKQVKTFGPRPITYAGEPATITAKVRFDDECGNGHNTFAITADIRAVDKRTNPREGGWIAGGCCHDEIAKAFPELAPFIKWHLCSSDGPMHYTGNATYHASDRDHWGHAAGEPCAFEYGVRFGDSPVTHRLPGNFWKWLQARYGTGSFTVVAFAHDRDPERYGPHYTFAGFGEKWHECPFRDKAAADEFAEGFNRCRVEWVKVATEFSKGKPRDLDAARSAAVWPEATDDDLTAPGLKERLEARLPALLAEFRAAVESLGFTW